MVYNCYTSPAGADIGILGFGRNYRKLIDRFNQLAQQHEGLEDINSELSKIENTGYAIWKIDDHLEIYCDSHLAVILANEEDQTFRTKTYPDSKYIKIPLEEAHYTIICCKNTSLAPISKFLNNRKIPPTDGECLSFEITEYMRNISMIDLGPEYSVTTDFVTTGVIIDNCSFNRIEEYKIEHESDIADTVSSIIGRTNKWNEFELRLIISELVSNAFKHGKIKESCAPMWLRTAEGERSIYLEGVDMRYGYERIETPTHINYLSEDGRGVFLIQQYADRFFTDATSSTAKITQKKSDPAER